VRFDKMQSLWKAGVKLMVHKLHVLLLRQVGSLRAGYICLCYIRRMVFGFDAG